MAGDIVFVVFASLFGWGEMCWGEMWLYDFACPTKPRRRRTLSVGEAESKMEVGANSEEVKLIEDKG